MDLSKPHSVLSSVVDGDVLRVLAGSTHPFTGRDIGRLAGRTHTSAQRSLDRLVAHGLVDKTPAGRAALYVLNRDHLAFPVIEALVSLRSTLFTQLRESLETWQIPPMHASLFGSAARGDGDNRSDIDLLLVRSDGVDADDPTWRSQTDALASKVRRWTGNHLAILELTEDAVQEMSRKNPPIARSLKGDAISLTGPNLHFLLRTK